MCGQSEKWNICVTADHRKYTPPVAACNPHYPAELVTSRRPAINTPMYVHIMFWKFRKRVDNAKNEITDHRKYAPPVAACSPHYPAELVTSSRHTINTSRYVHIMFWKSRKRVDNAKNEITDHGKYAPPVAACSPHYPAELVTNSRITINAPSYVGIMFWKPPKRADNVKNEITDHRKYAAPVAAWNPRYPAEPITSSRPAINTSRYVYIMSWKSQKRVDN